MLVYLFWILSVGGSVALCAVLPLSYRWLFALIPGVFLAENAVWLLYLYVSSLFLSLKCEPGRDNPYCRCVTGVVISWILTLFRVSYTVEGKEKLPQGPFVLVANHRSDFDPMVTFDALRRRVRLSYITKTGNVRIPIAGRYIYHTGFLPIERDNPMQSLRTIRTAATLVKDRGTSVGIYPEGTRAKTDELLPFKEGAFLLAKRAGAPLVVMTTRGTEKISGNLIRRRTRVRVRILGVIDRETVFASSTAELSAMTRAMMEADLSTSFPD